MRNGHVIGDHTKGTDEGRYKAPGCVCVGGGGDLAPSLPNRDVWSRNGGI